MAKGTEKTKRSRSVRKGAGRRGRIKAKRKSGVLTEDLPHLSAEELLACFPEPLILYGRDSTAVYVNTPAVESLGFDPTGLSMEELRDRIGLHGVNGSEPLQDGASPAAAGAERPFRNVLCTFRHAKGGLRAILASSSPIPHEDRTSGIVVTWRDVTDQIEIRDDAALGRAATQSGLAPRSPGFEDSRTLSVRSERLSDIGALAATVAHELRNPLGVIRTAAFNIRRKSADPALHRHIDNIDKKIEESTMIINNLLNYSKITSPSTTTVRLADILNECISSVKKRFNTKDIAFSKRLRAAGSRPITADPHQLREVFLNILNNAAQAIDDRGTIRITARIEEGKAVVDIFDDGCGIDEKHLGKVFVPFFSNRPKGTGLGLSICRELVELHGGTISILSRRGEGTTVSVSLPAQRENA